ncbi:MAG: NUDIX domain-containing protein [Phycisphaerales bacterium]
MPTIRTDIIDAYLFRESAGTVEFLQLRRTEQPLAGTWQPVMGHLEASETAVNAAVREIAEETGLDVRGPDCTGFWALESVHPFFLPAADAIVLSPCFAARVTAAWSPTLDREHDRLRWISEAEIDKGFMWPGQRNACREVLTLALTGVLTRLSL